MRYHITEKTVDNIYQFANSIDKIIGELNKIEVLFDEDEYFNETICDLNLGGENFVFPKSVDDYRIDLKEYRNKLYTYRDKIKQNTPVYVINNELNKTLPEILS